ncbi:tigger transposable element-derived protein 4-like [Aedes aegypti]|uniref:Uncharacterized protein n=1 Tax=Aedes aegypti TaxID=7159 RepID=A0A6I8U0G6_AEDAE|nr:tigger transposable element-derived protein 4-like [Aedes aegypti]
MPQSTVSTIVKNKEKWLAKEIGHNPLAKKFKSVADIRLERSMEIFVNQARASNLPLSGAIIQEKARAFATQLQLPEFKGSSGWLTKFVKRQKLSFKKICGESAAVDTEMTDEWVNSTLPGLIDEYEPHNIFNADETGLFYKCLPDKTFTFQKESCHGGKFSKQRLSVMCAANMDGSEKLPLLVIGKSKNPRCFKNVKSLPVLYESNTKAWMTSLIFEKWLIDLDKKFEMENRQVLMFVDNCTAHPKAVQEKLKFIKLHFFPPNATSVLQPLDLGVIKALKHHYRHSLVKQRIDEMEQRKAFTEITVLDAINILSKAWAVDVKPSTISSCFRKDS